jgi:hypothetical protein
MADITHGQKQALARLLNLHDRHPQQDYGFPTCMIGVSGSTSALLRKLEPAGLVKVNRGHGKPGTRFFYSITEAGRAALSHQETAP